jgi:hypothetical protein
MNESNESISYFGSVRPYFMRPDAGKASKRRAYPKNSSWDRLVGFLWCHVNKNARPLFSSTWNARSWYVRERHLIIPIYLVVRWLWGVEARSNSLQYVSNNRSLSRIYRHLLHVYPLCIITTSRIVSNTLSIILYTTKYSPWSSLFSLLFLLLLRLSPSTKLILERYVLLIFCEINGWHQLLSSLEDSTL